MKEHITIGVIIRVALVGIICVVLGASIKSAFISMLVAGAVEIIISDHLKKKNDKT